MMKVVLPLTVALISLTLPACHSHEEHAQQEQHQIVVTTPLVKDIVITQPYVCQIRSQIYTEIRPLNEGYLEEVAVKEGQTVKKGDVLFKIFPPLYKARLEAEKAEAQYAKIKYDTTKSLYDQKVVSDRDVAMHQAELSRAEAKLQLAETELKFATILAPFDGIVDRQLQQQGSLVKKEDLLTTLSDNSVMRAYFNVPEARYLEYMSGLGLGGRPPTGQIELPDSRIELVLANCSTFNHAPDKAVTIEGKFNNETGNIAFRADFPNPEGILRHGQTGTVVVHRLLKNSVVIPQRATFETLDRQYVWVVGGDGVVHQRPITVAYELEDIYVIKSGLDVIDKIILEGVQQVHDGEKVEYEFRKPGETLADQKYPAQ